MTDSSDSYESIPRELYKPLFRTALQSHPRCEELVERLASGKCSLEEVDEILDEAGQYTLKAISDAAQGGEKLVQATES